MAIIVPCLKMKDNEFGPYLREFDLLADISLEKYYQDQVDKYNNDGSVVEEFNFIQNNYGNFRSTQYYCDYYKSASAFSITYGITEKQAIRVKDFLTAYPGNKNAIDLINSNNTNLWSYLLGKWKSSEGEYYFIYSRDEDGGHVGYGLLGELPSSCYFTLEDGMLYYYTKKESVSNSSYKNSSYKIVPTMKVASVPNTVQELKYELIKISIIDANSFIATANDIIIIMNRQLTN